MKKIIFAFLALAVSAFGFNYSGTWVNKSVAKYNDPIKLKINGNSVTPYIKRGANSVKLKRKVATNTGNGLFEAWGFGYKNLVLFIKPINSNKIKVYEKKIDTKKRIVITRSFIFKKRASLNKKLKKAFVGNWRSTDPFSAVSKLNIRVVDNQVFVRAWRKIYNHEEPLGLAEARYYNKALYITWYKGNLIVKATITGLHYDVNLNRYKTLKLSLKVKNINNGLENSQIIYFKRKTLRPPLRPFKKHIKVGPVDINLLINSY